MKTFISTAIIFIAIFVATVTVARENITMKEWKGNNVLVQAKMKAINKEISSGLVLELNIRNDSPDDIWLTFVKGDKPESCLLYKCTNLLSKSDVKRIYEPENSKKTWIGKLSHLFIKPQTTYSLKVNLLDQFVIEKKQHYSLEIQGFLYFKGFNHTEFTIKDLQFTVD